MRDSAISFNTPEQAHRRTLFVLFTLGLLGLLPIESLAAPHDSTPLTTHGSTLLPTIGLAVRSALGEPTDIGIAGRLAADGTDPVGYSLRASLIFGNRDRHHIDNQEPEFHLSATIDMRGEFPLRPFVGAGAAWNTDSSHGLNPMLTGGLDLQISDRLVLGVVLHHIIQTDIDDTDLETITCLQFAF